MEALFPLAETQTKVTKRKSDAAAKDDEDDYVETAKPAAKKPRASKAGNSKAKADPFSHAKQLVQAIITAPQEFPLPADASTTRSQLITLAEYAVALTKGEAAGAEGTRIIKAKSEEEIDALADKVRKVVLAGIRKQMTVSPRALRSGSILICPRFAVQWKAACKRGSATWAYEGVAADPSMFCFACPLLQLIVPHPQWSSSHSCSFHLLPHSSRPRSPLISCTRYLMWTASKRLSDTTPSRSPRRRSTSSGTRIRQSLGYLERTALDNSRHHASPPFLFVLFRSFLIPLLTPLGVTCGPIARGRTAEEASLHHP